MTPDSQQSQLVRVTTRLEDHIKEQHRTNEQLWPLVELYGRLGARVDATDKDVTSVADLVRAVEARFVQRCKEIEDKAAHELEERNRQWQKRFDDEVDRGRFSKNLASAAIPSTIGVCIALATFLYMVLSAH